MKEWVAGRNGALAFYFDSAAKCWLDEDGILRFVIAWGHNGDHFHNRQGPLPKIMGPLSWLKPMDLRLRGKRLIRQTLLPHPGVLSDAGLLALVPMTGERARTAKMPTVIRILIRPP